MYKAYRKGYDAAEQSPILKSLGTKSPSKHDETQNHSISQLYGQPNTTLIRYKNGTDSVKSFVMRRMTQSRRQSILNRQKQFSDPSITDINEKQKSVPIHILQKRKSEVMTPLNDSNLTSFTKHSKNRKTINEMNFSTEVMKQSRFSPTKINGRV